VSINTLNPLARKLWHHYGISLDKVMFYIGF
jgi:hypothetical protein